MTARLDGRNGEVWRRHTIYGWTQERCAEHFDISQSRVSEIIAEVRKQVQPLIQEQAAADSREFLLDVKARALEIADLAGAPVAVGKDGNILYEPCETHGQDDPCNADCRRVVVRDYSGRLNALKTAAMIDAQMAKRFGLDAPEKRELSGQVRYEIVGVDDDDLT
jgi:hypothetical protein